MTRELNVVTHHPIYGKRFTTFLDYVPKRRTRAGARNCPTASFVDTLSPWPRNTDFRWLSLRRTPSERQAPSIPKIAGTEPPKPDHWSKDQLCNQSCTSTIWSKSEFRNVTRYTLYGMNLYKNMTIRMTHKCYMESTRSGTWLKVLTQRFLIHFNINH